MRNLRLQIALTITALAVIIGAVLIPLAAEAITVSNNNGNNNTNTSNTNSKPNSNNSNSNNANTNSSGPIGSGGTGIKSAPDYDNSLGEFGNPLTLNTVPEIVAKAIRILLALVGMLSVVVIIIAGFRMVSQGDNPAQVKKARAAITWAIVGLLTALLSFSVVSIVQRIIQK